MPTVLRNLSRRSRPFRYAGHAGWAALVVLQLGAGLQNVAMLCCLAYCVVWPFLLDGLQRWHAQPAFTTRLHVVEGCTTGLLLGCAPLSTTGTVAVVAALLAGNAALAGRGLMLRVGVALGLGYLAASLVGGSRARFPLASEWLAAVLLVAYVGALGLTSFAQAQRLHGLQQQLARRSEVLAQATARLGRYVPDKLQQRVLSSPEQLCALERRWQTVAFVDVVGFVRLAATSEAETLAAVLNAYYGALAEVTDLHGGTLMMLQCDGALICFGDATRSRTDSALAAVAWASRLPSLLAELSVDWRADGHLVELEVRVGLASGYCSVGDWGGQRLDFSVIGGAVNLAARLQHHAPTGGALLCATTGQLLAQRLPERVGAPYPLQLKGLGTVMVCPLVDLTPPSANVPAA